MHTAIHPNKMVLEHTVVREVVTYLYQLSQPLPEQAFTGRLELWYVVPPPGAPERVAVHCGLTGVFYEHESQRLATGEYATLQSFEDFILRNAATALQWRLSCNSALVKTS